MTKGGSMEPVFFILVLVVWFVLQAFVLPKFGVAT